jgi:hypothetical protein
MIFSGPKFEETGLPRRFQSSQARLDKGENNILTIIPMEARKSSRNGRQYIRDEHQYQIREGRATMDDSTLIEPMSPYLW